MFYEHALRDKRGNTHHARTHMLITFTRYDQIGVQAACLYCMALLMHPARLRGGFHTFFCLVCGLLVTH